MYPFGGVGPAVGVVPGINVLVGMPGDELVVAVTPASGVRGVGDAIGEALDVGRVGDGGGEGVVVGTVSVGGAAGSDPGAVGGNSWLGTSC